ncbi:hypothetical protein ABPG77_001038 [Micractinium sp. CCAP 211/92]
MTKYGHYLAALDRDCPAAYKGKFLAYKRLKKCLKKCQAAAASAGQDAKAAEAELERCQLLFFELLSAELSKANSCFVIAAKAIVLRYQHRAYWCRKYARANAVALRKILKKYDKLCGGQRGRSFLQHCWQLPTGGAFLHSPLLDELKAIQDILQEPRMQQPEDMALCEVANTGTKAGHQVAAATPAAGVSTAHSPGTAVLAPIQVPRNAGSGCAVNGPSSACSEQAAPRGILESPTCMLSSSDFEWAPEDGCSGCGGAVSTAAPVTARAVTVAAAAPSEWPVLQQQPHSSARSSAPSSATAVGNSPVASPRSASTSSGSKLMQLLRGHGQAAAGPCGSAGGTGGRGPSAAGEEPPAEALAAAEGGSAAPPGTPPLRKQISTRFRDDELRCPICLDALYKPVGLACGHKFCKECALGNAGLARAIGTFANLASYVRGRTACPQCRQPGVYREAIRLRHLDRVVRARFPRDWEERRREERAAKSRAVEAAAPASHSWVQTINARDALLGF